MRLGILRAFCAFVSLATAERAFAEATLYGTNRAGDLFTININSGAATLVGTLPAATLCPSLPTPAGITEIEFSNVSRRAFAQCQDGAFAGFEFDINTAAAIGGLIGNGGSYTGLETVDAFWLGTVIFSGGGGAPSQVRVIDPFTGASTLIGPTGVGAISGLAFHTGSATMYGIAGGPGPANLYTIDLTGAATVVGSSGIQAGSLEFGPDGRLYAGGTGPTDGGKLFVIDRITGASTLVGLTGFANVTGLTLVEPDFFTLTPCRVIDTRNPPGPVGGPALVAGADRTFPLAGTCGIPLSAKAISVNIAVTGSTAAGNLRLHPGGTAVPLIASINYGAGQTRSNNAVVQVNTLGELAVFAGQASGTVHFILDVNGYFR